jgi:hypothetical protein
MIKYKKFFSQINPQDEINKKDLMPLLKFIGHKLNLIDNNHENQNLNTMIKYKKFFSQINPKDEINKNGLMPLLKLLNANINSDKLHYIIINMINILKQESQDKKISQRLLGYINILKSKLKNDEYKQLNMAIKVNQPLIPWYFYCQNKNFLWQFLDQDEQEAYKNILNLHQTATQLFHNKLEEMCAKKKDKRK